MPLFMDTHRDVTDLTVDAVTGAHQADLATQEKYGSFMKRTVVLAVVFASVVASCGGGTEDTSSSADAGRFCELLVEFQEPNGIELGGDVAREAVAEGRAALDELVAVAPAELKAVMERGKVGGDAYLDLVEAADYDVYAIDFAALVALETPELEADGEAVDVWMAANCQ